MGATGKVVVPSESTQKGDVINFTLGGAAQAINGTIAIDFICILPLYTHIHTLYTTNSLATLCNILLFRLKAPSRMADKTSTESGTFQCAPFIISTTRQRVSELAR